MGVKKSSSFEASFLMFHIFPQEFTSKNLTPEIIRLDIITTYLSSFQLSTTMPRHSKQARPRLSNSVPFHFGADAFEMRATTVTEHKPVLPRLRTNSNFLMNPGTKYCTFFISTPEHAYPVPDDIRCGAPPPPSYSPLLTPSVPPTAPHRVLKRLQYRYPMRGRLA